MSRPLAHGTRGGYMGHKRRGQDPCEPCRAANADDRKAYLVRSRDTKAVNIPAEALGRLLRELDEDTLAEVSRLIGPLTAEACMEVAGLEDLSVIAAAKENVA